MRIASAEPATANKAIATDTMEITASSFTKHMAHISWKQLFFQIFSRTEAGVLHPVKNNLDIQPLHASGNAVIAVTADRRSLWNHNHGFLILSGSVSHVKISCCFVGTSHGRIRTFLGVVGSCNGFCGTFLRSSSGRLHSRAIQNLIYFRLDCDRIVTVCFQLLAAFRIISPGTSNNFSRYRLNTLSWCLNRLCISISIILRTDKATDISAVDGESAFFHGVGVITLDNNKIAG